MKAVLNSWMVVDPTGTTELESLKENWTRTLEEGGGEYNTAG